MHKKVIWDGQAHKNSHLFLPQMFKNSLKWQGLLVLTLMGFQLVPLVESLSTAPMITLKENKRSANIKRSLLITKFGEQQKGTWENRIIVLYIGSSGAGALEPCGSSSSYLWQRLRSIRRPHTWRQEQVTVQRENRDDMLPFSQNVGTRWLTCVAFPHCDWAHVWRADSGCKSSCHSSHKRMVSEVKGGKQLLTGQTQYQLLYVHFSHCSVWLPAGQSHLPIPCVCKDEPLASTTYWI